MGSKQHVLTVQILENNDSFTMQTGCVKDKGNVYAAGCFRCNESSFGCDFLAVDEQFFAVRLVHENAGYGVFLFRLEIGIRYFIKNRYLTERIDAVAILRGRCRSNLRYADFDGLIFRIDVLMHSQQRVGTIQLIKDNQFCIFI